MCNMFIACATCCVSYCMCNMLCFLLHVQQVVVLIACATVLHVQQVVVLVACATGCGACCMRNRLWCLLHVQQVVVLVARATGCGACCMYNRLCA